MMTTITDMQTVLLCLLMCGSVSAAGTEGGRVARHRAVADAVNKLRTLVADPKIHRYWDDYAL